MSKVELEFAEKVLLSLNEMEKTVVEVKDVSKLIDEDIQDMLEIFEEDQVVMYGCR